MGKRKGRKALRNAPPPSSSSVKKGPNFTGDTGGSSPTATPKESQMTRSSMPPPPPRPNAKAASSNTAASVPNDSKETKKKPKENPHSPLPLICITRLLKGTAHCPHFCPLRKYTGIVRGQLESAWDQAFIETANQIHGLELKDFWVNGKKLWKATADLQTMGYNLIPLRRRLLETRDLMLKLEADVSKILNLKRVAAKLEKEMDSLHQGILHMVKLDEEGRIKLALAREEAEKKEDELPKYNGLMSELAKKPFDP